MQGAKIIDLQTIQNSKGDLTFVEEANHIPFSIKRIYYLYNIPNGSERGGHAHKNLKQLIIPLSGSFTVILDNGSTKEAHTLNNPSKGLLLENMLWRELVDFSSNAVCMVLASELYDEDDYYRNYDDFLEARQNEQANKVS